MAAPAPEVTEAAPAKVNLHLHVTGRRADGYHLLDSLVVFAAVGDTVTASPAPRLELTISGPEGDGLSAGEDNLVLRAARALAGDGARLHLEKRLPVASGIGGGSADAAAALRALDRLWSLGLGPEGLRDIAARLGADVPVCLASRPTVMRGIGDVALPAPALPDFGILLANPRLALPTPAVFAAREGAFTAPASLPASWPDAAAMADDLRLLGNDLEPAAVRLCPPVGEVLSALARLPGALLARMSGSGATCFSLFGSAAAAERAMTALPSTWWRWAGALRDGLQVDPHLAG
ncbi:4-(cytidine 5'-diphospho)-2-C-methyl-D-erythritol kinase [Roseomonas sp. CCTCC AB2023176]|uniref:4-(cytidine 5'-diphospho)-2-C-methyl-D-erythritol kinase n=1 Tax=Roseomonas sp. CCTCC AB2023176 TaxID=3342640 RepID=UPI0035D6CF9B